MKSITLIVFFLFTFILHFSGFSQKGKTYVGIQYKPIVPNKFIGAYQQAYARTETPSFEGEIVQKLGYVTGVTIRHGISKNISIETGINYVNRRFNISYDALDSNYQGNTDTKLINYNIPINALVYIQIGDQWYMNASGGANISFFPTIVGSYVNLGDTKNYFFQESTPTNWLQFGVNANYGFEYRTKDAGVFYLGASYYLPFRPIVYSKMVWVNQSVNRHVIAPINGSYFTVDLKYFIPNT
ncbi:PorT family protein [Putridiphycobacter roseus]|nr:PorT family protein [Putridiphycobacter roseus]